MPVDNVHLTLRWFGDAPFAADELMSALAPLTGSGAVTLAIQGVKGFGPPRPGQPFAGVVETSPALMTLAARVDAAAATLGLPRRDQPFRPHVTLARLGRDTVTDQRATDCRFTVGTLCLVSSVLEAAGPRFTILERLSLV